MSSRTENNSFCQHPLLNRRDFLALSSGAALLVLTGCGGGGASSARDEIFTRTIDVAVDPIQVGGATLKIQSLYQLDVPITAGRTSVKVAAKVPQMLVVTDSANKIRATGLTVPSTSATTFTVNAVSTAASLVFLTPGILSNIPREATERLSRIQALNSFPALLSYLTQNLATKPLEDLRPLPALDSLVAACVKEWINFEGSIKATAINNPTNAGFTLYHKSGAPSGEVVLENSGWRYLNIVRQDLDAQGNELIPPRPVQHAMEGASGLSIGTLFAGIIGAGSTETDTIVVSRNQTIARYWVRGPGFASNSGIAPLSVEKADSDFDAFLYSVIYYIFFPLVDSLGTITRVARLFDTAKVDKILMIIQGSKSAQDALDAAEKRDVLKAAAALNDLILPLLPAILQYISDDALIAAIGIQAGAFLRAFGYFILLLGGANLLYAITQWVSYPRNSSFDLAITAA